MVYVLVIALTFDDYDLPMVPAFGNLVTLSGCTDATCGDHTASRFSMPLTSLGAKKYYLGIFFKVHTNLIISDKYTYMCKMLQSSNPPAGELVQG